MCYGSDKAHIILQTMKKYGICTPRGRGEGGIVEGGGGVEVQQMSYMLKGTEEARWPQEGGGEEEGGVRARGGARDKSLWRT